MDISAGSKKAYIVTGIITLILCVCGIVIFFLSQSGYRLIKTGTGASIQKDYTPQVYAKEFLKDHNLVLYENGNVILDMSLKDLKMTGDITGVQERLLIRDFTGSHININSNHEALKDVIRYINSSRNGAVPATLTVSNGIPGVIPFTPSEKIDTERFCQAVDDLLKNMTDIYPSTLTLDVTDIQDIYEQYPDNTALMQERMEELEGWHISYNNGQKITAADFKGHIIIRNSRFFISATAEDIKNILDKKLSSYNDKKDDYDFITSSGETIRIKNITYTLTADNDKEAVHILKMMSLMESEDYRTPEYIASCISLEKNTYIEVSKNDQHMWYYKDGELILDCDVVTGLAGLRDTPSGLYYIRNKAKNARLKGPTWDVTVNRWMAVTTNGVGIHDATWRRNFGGDIYKTNGSHGCINTPLSIMKELYDSTNEGTPVFIY